MDGVPVPQSLPTCVACSDDRVTALFDVHYERLYRLARRLPGSRDDALDLSAQSRCDGTSFAPATSSRMS